MSWYSKWGTGAQPQVSPVDRAVPPYRTAPRAGPVLPVVSRLDPARATTAAQARRILLQAWHPRLNAQRSPCKRLSVIAALKNGLLPPLFSCPGDVGTVGGWGQCVAAPCAGRRGQGPRGRAAARVDLSLEHFGTYSPGA